MVNGTACVDLKLQVGSITGAGHRRGRRPAGRDENATLGIVIDRAEGRRPSAERPQLHPARHADSRRRRAAAAPRRRGPATPRLAGSATSTGGFNVNGMRNQSNNFLLDGSPNNDTFNTGFVLRPPPDAIEEFKILTHSYDAEYGRNAGSVVNVVTKSGEQRLARRALGVQPRRRAAGAQLLRATTKPALKQNQFGGALGGPIAKNRAVLLRLLRGLQQPAGHDRQPRGAERGAARRRLLGRRGDPRSADGAAVSRQRDSRRTASARSPRASSRTTTCRCPNTAAQPLHAIARRAGRRASSSGSRLDYRSNDAHTLLGRYMSRHTNNVNPLGGSNSRRRATPRMPRCRTSWDRTPGSCSPNMINVARANLEPHRRQAERDERASISSRLGFNMPARNATAAGLPFITVNGFFTHGRRRSSRSRPRPTTSSASATTSPWVTGRHSMQVRRRDAARSDLDRVHQPAERRLHVHGRMQRQRRGRLPARRADAVPRRAAGDPNLDGSSWTYADLRAGRVPRRIAADAELRPAATR